MQFQFLEWGVIYANLKGKIVAVANQILLLFSMMLIYLLAFANLAVRLDLHQVALLFVPIECFE